MFTITDGPAGRADSGHEWQVYPGGGPPPYVSCSPYDPDFGRWVWEMIEALLSREWTVTLNPAGSITEHHCSHHTFPRQWDASLPLCLCKALSAMGLLEGSEA